MVEITFASKRTILEVHLSLSPFHFRFFFPTGGVLFYKNVGIGEFSLPSQSCGPPALTSSALQPPSMTKAGLAHSHALSQVLESAPSLLVPLSNQDSPHESILPCKISWMDSQPQSKKSRFCAGFMLGQKEKAVS